MFGRTPDEVIDVARRADPGAVPRRARAYIERFANTGETSRRMGPQTALWALRADGTEFPIEASISQATIGGRAPHGDPA
jgi:hypothetical protein